MPGTPWTAEDNAELLRRYADGDTYASLATRFGRTKKAVIRHLDLLDQRALHEAAITSGFRCDDCGHVTEFTLPAGLRAAADGEPVAGVNDWNCPDCGSRTRSALTVDASI